MGTGAGRLLAVDWGERRIGLALSDESQVLASPLTTLTRRPGKRFPMQQLLSLIEQHEVTGVVVGLPLEADGTDGTPAVAARTLAQDIARHSSLPVALWDERFTTARVRRAVQEMGGTTRGTKAQIDALAATLVLQQYLDAQRGSAT